MEVSDAKPTSGIFIGSFLSKVQGKSVTCCSYSEVIEQLSHWTPPMTLELRTPPGLEGSLRKRSGRLLKSWDTHHFVLERAALFFGPPGQAKSNPRKFELKVRCPRTARSSLRASPPRGPSHMPANRSLASPVPLSCHCFKGAALRVIPPAEFSREFCFSLTSGTETLVLQVQGHARHRDLPASGCQPVARACACAASARALFQARS